MTNLSDIIILATEAVQTAVECLPDAASCAVPEASATAESGGVLGTLGINWKLFLAQLVNFSIVLFIFWKWVVKPLGATLTKRQERIESGLKNADLMESEKKNFELWRTQEMSKARKEAESIIKSASDAGSQLKQQMLTETQTQSKKLQEQALAQIESEKTQMLRDVKAEVADMVVMAAEKILSEKLNGQKDQDFIERTLGQAK